MNTKYHVYMSIYVYVKCDEEFQQVTRNRWQNGNFQKLEDPQIVCHPILHYLCYHCNLGTITALPNVFIDRLDMLEIADGVLQKYN